MHHMPRLTFHEVTNIRTVHTSSFLENDFNVYVLTTGCHAFNLPLKYLERRYDFGKTYFRTTYE